ncbi:aldo/keto reductase [Rapidithrix thailandica]|uniref:Aldo/keto reductase n=1 Tax=Rapidithrix thailandica TaxID=413964 RepID=A0AAW9S4I6_9BACT
MPDLPIYIKNHLQPPRLPERSRIVLGTAGLGGAWKAVDGRASVEAILFALEQGVNSLDTAPSYHQAETYVGQALRQWKGPKPFISTKMGRLQTEAADIARFDYSKEGMRKSVYNSLETLGIDCIDLLFLHEPHIPNAAEIDQAMELMQELKEEGLIGKAGLGGNPVPAFDSYIRQGLIEVVMGYNQFDACSLKALHSYLPDLLRQGVAFYAGSPLHMGLLGNRLDTYSKDRPEWVSREELAIAQKLQVLAAETGISLPGLAHRFLFSCAEVDCIVLGPRTHVQLQNSLTYWQEGKLPEEVFQQLCHLLT